MGVGRNSVGEAPAAALSSRPAPGKARGLGRGYLPDDAERVGAEWFATIDDPFSETQAADRWETLPPALWAGADTQRAWGSSASDVFRVRRDAGANLERYDGSRWTAVFDYRVHDAAGSGPEDVWFATEREPIS